jgi:hypothetical protein
LVSHETARTVGDSNHELIGGLGLQGGNLVLVNFKWNYGLTQNLDLGLYSEVFSIGIRAKYAFISNNKAGWSLATALGSGATSFGSTHRYVDIVGSYLAKSWEPYGTLRIVRVVIAPFDLRNKETGSIFYTFSGSQHDYGQFIMGTRYWFSPRWLFSLEASSLFPMTSSLEIRENFLVSGSFGFRF